jgi:hypothetical protein
LVHSGIKIGRWHGFHPNQLAYMKRIIPAVVLFCISTLFGAAQTDGGTSGAESTMVEEQAQPEIRAVQTETEKGAAKKQTSGTNTVLTPSAGADEKAGHFDLQFQNIDMNQLLGIYAHVKGRSVLRHPSFPRISFDLNASCTNQGEAARAIEKVFEAKGITTILDGEKFVLVVPKGQASAPITNSTVSVNPAKDGTPQDKTIPAGEIRLLGVDVRQVLAIYASLVGRKVVQSDNVPPVLISFTSSTPLTTLETIHALDTLFRWNGLKVVPVGDDSIKVVSISSP